MKKHNGGGKTNAMRLLDAAKIAYEVLSYDSGGNYMEGGAVARAIGLPEEQVFKTLLLREEKGQYLVCCIPVCGSLDTKGLARAWGSKSVDMLPLKDLLPVTGYIRGACSPVGMKKSFPTFMDDSALSHSKIAVSAGQRGLQLSLSATELIAYLKAKTGSFVKSA